MVPFTRSGAERRAILSPLRTTLRVGAIVAPRVTGHSATEVRPTAPSVALKALAPTSLVQLDPRADSLRRMRELVERVPCYALDLGSDLDGVVRGVRGLLAGCR